MRSTAAVAAAPIGTDEIVAIKGGHIVDTATLRSLPERLQNSDVQIAGGFHLVAVEEAEDEPVMLFLNHSCEPNVGFAGNIVLVAMREIGTGEGTGRSPAAPARCPGAPGASRPAQVPACGDRVVLAAAR